MLKVRLDALGASILNLEHNSVTCTHVLVRAAKTNKSSQTTSPPDQTACSPDVLIMSLCLTGAIPARQVEAALPSRHPPCLAGRSQCPGICKGLPGALHAEGVHAASCAGLAPACRLWS